MAEDEVRAGGEDETAEPTVSTRVEAEVVTLTVEGELTEAGRRPLVREMTELLLSGQPLRRVDLDLRAVGYMNSAGMAVLVQLQKMAAPRGVEVTLVAPTAAVARPLQLTGLWHRFPVIEADGSVSGAPESAPGS